MNKETVVYAISLSWPTNNSIYLASPFPSVKTTVVSLLGYPNKLDWKPAPTRGMIISLPQLSVSELPCQWAWTLKIEGLIQQKRTGPFMMPRFDVDKPPHPHYRPRVTYT